jgi:hypothetical protein
MGLDIYLFKRAITPKGKAIDELKGNVGSCAYWRQDWELHNFMWDLLGRIENCEALNLTKENMKKLINFCEKRGDEEKEIQNLYQILNGDWENYSYFFECWW